MGKANHPNPERLRAGGRGEILVPTATVAGGMRAVTAHLQDTHISI
jgi:hypothetical protein